MGRRTLDVDAEYTEAFHTKSFVDIWARAHRQTRESPDGRGGGGDVIGTRKQHSSPLPHDSYTHLSEFLLEPTQESLSSVAASAGDRRVAALLLDYLDATFQSFDACTSLLASIDRTRSLHRATLCLLVSLSVGTEVAGELSGFVDLGNPLSQQNLACFDRAHAMYPPLMPQLTAERRRLRRRARLLRIAKCAVGVVAISVVGAVAMAAIAVAAHAAVVVAAVTVPLLASGRQRYSRKHRRSNLGWLERAGRRVDAAARGAYIVERDMDTVSRMVRRVHDEVEHGRDVARLVLLSKEKELAREVVRDMEIGEHWFQEQLEELEEHVYLCLLTINRSRRLFAEEMGEDRTSSV
ncbi:hypothetical protein HPP92_008339 [Vanilla planifolia]|uniref:Uncharacterized protein n=1 Tax=Vanilla planifolia TaxID=51239 RepID=A0A835RA87_VANPL|nr:hypothetical protein HPP92_008339 [Vanilla planifolia]